VQDKISLLEKNLNPS